MGVIFAKFRRDMAGILYLVFGLFTALSLFSFRATDPSFNSIGSGLKVHNFCGFAGSFLSDFLYQLWGMPAWLLVAAFIRLSIRSFRHQEVSIANTRTLWAFLSLLTGSSLLALYFPETRLYSGQIPIGGLFGTLVANGLTTVFNFVGVSLILWALTLILVIFYTEKPVSEIFKSPKHGAMKAIAVWGVISEWLAERREVAAERAALAPKKIDKPKAAATADEEGIPKKKLRFALLTRLNGEKKEEEPSADEEEAPEQKTVISMSSHAADDEEEIEDEEEPSADSEGVAVIPKNETIVQTMARRKVKMTAKVQRRIENWKLPELGMLEDPPDSRIRVDEREIKRKAEILTHKLSQFSVKGEVQGAKPGPAVTMYEFKPNSDVKISKITELADDLSLALSSESVRIIAPIPGRDVVGIETSNSHRETVFLKDILANDFFWSDKNKLPLALGRQADGETKVVDLRKMPHLLVAGTTGSGKSVFVVSIITGLLFKHSPKTLRLILVDPKQVDLAAFGHVPHLLMPPIREPRKAVTALKWAIREMEKRYRSMSKFGARGIESFNEIVDKFSKEENEKHENANLELENANQKLEQYYHTSQPYIVIVVEEFGDLMSVDKVNVEQAVVRLAQMARACGIHLILAMQSPRKDVVTGLIKTNIPGRISFKVASKMDSRIILDESGAERLLAQGDMLFLAPGVSKPQRHHGAWVTEEEITAVMKFWSDQGEPQFDPLAMKALEGTGGGFDLQGSEDGGDPLAGDGDDSDYDEKYDEVLSWVSAQKEVSASLLQRKFRLGYPRAARMVEVFEREGVVGPANGSKPRQVLVSSYTKEV